MTFNPDNPREHEKPKAVQPPAPETPASGVLEWQQASRWHLLTACGYYSVGKALVRRVPSYGAWFRPNGRSTDIPHHLGEFALPELAKGACQSHRDKFNGKHPEPTGRSKVWKP